MAGLTHVGSAGGLWRGTGGFAVIRPSLNLLRYPRRWQPVHSPTLAWALSGLAIGLMAAVGWGLWCEHEQEAWLQQRADLRARLARQSDAEAAAAAQAQQARWLQQLERRRADWQAGHAQQMRLHTLLAQASAASGLRLQRWQGDGQRMQLQGWLPGSHALTDLQALLSSSGSPTWTWQSLTAEPSGGVQWVLESSRQPPGPGAESRRP